MAKPDDFENYKLEMLAEACKDVFERKDKQHVMEVDIPRMERSPERRPTREVGSSSSSRPEWLRNALTMMNGYNEKFIINRTLNDSESNTNQSRFSMPLKQVMSSDFLTAQEMKIIDEQAILKTRKDGVSVVLVDPLLNVYYLDLKRWKVGGGLSYVLNSGWNDVVAMNRFRVGHETDIWSFRYGSGKLGFAMSPLREKPEEEKPKPKVRRG